ncbi:MAG: 3D domain-containing protein [Gaiellaceae bacterium]
MQPRLRTLSAAALAAAIALLGVALIPAASGADAGRRAGDLRTEDSALAAKSRSALLELYSLDSQLERARARLASVRDRSAAVARERAAVRSRLGIARRTLSEAERLLAERLRALYEHGETDPLEIVLGASSLEEAMAGLDGLTFAARQDQAIVERTRAARRSLARTARTLRARSAELHRIEAAAAAETASLARARADRAAYLSRLAQERRLKAAQIAALEQQASAAQSRTATLGNETAAAVDPDRAAAVESQDAAAQVPGVRTLTVLATGYSLPGRTATGIPTGWGVVAVDPSLIPLGTRMTIPGYGQGIAADTGGSVRGAVIDLWFPSRGQALAWGRRTVTIRLH